MDDRDLAYAGIARQATMVRSGDLSSRDLTATVLRRIDALNPALRAFTLVLAEQAMAEAAARDESLARDRDRDRHGDAIGPLHGVPVAIKAENDVAGVPTTFGGAAVRRPAAADSEVVRRLRAAGAVIVGITAMPEFGLWPFTESSANGYVRNPWDITRSTFGSSGGTAAAVAAGMVGAGLGGDGGGSIRLPASACGLFGLKPQRGRVSTAPNAALWRSLGTLGPLTRSVLDSAVFYDAVAGSTPVDRYRAAPAGMPYADAARRLPGRLRIAVSVRCPIPGVTPCAEHVAAVRRTADLLASLGHTVSEADPDYPEGWSTFMPQMLAGVRDEVALVDDPALLERRSKALLRVARAVLAAAVASAERRAGAYGARVLSVFDSHDLLLQPVTPERPPAIGVLDGAGAVTALRRSAPVVSYAGVWNIAGNPAASVPVGLASDGLPVAVQLVAPANGEVTILSVAAQIEAARPWTHLTPPV